MLCTSILSEIVLGFMMWSGWLGTSWTEKTYPCPEYVRVPAGQEYGSPPVGTACPQACVGCPMPAYYPQPTSPSPAMTGGVEVCEILSLPAHFAAWDKKEVFASAIASSGHEKPCSWRIQSEVKSPVADGLEVEIILVAANRDIKEVYKATKVLAFDSPTDVTLAGDRPEPVCLRVVARRPAQPMMPPNGVVWNMPGQPFQHWGGVPTPASQPAPLWAWSATMPVSYPAPMPPAFIAGAASLRIPDPIPVYSPEVAPYCLPIVPAGVTLPAPTPVHRASVKLVYESGKPRLCVKSEGMTTECLRMKLEAGAAGAIRLSAGKNRVHLAGTKWKAEADRVELGDDGRIVLAGHVKLTSDKLGVCAAVKAERLCVEVKAGKFEKIVESK